MRPKATHDDPIVEIDVGRGSRPATRPAPGVGRVAVDVSVRPIGGRRSGLGAWLAAAAVGLGLLGLVGLGRFGGSSGPVSSAAGANATPSSPAIGIAATPRGSLLAGMSTQGGSPGSRSGVSDSGRPAFSLPRFGYEVLTSERAGDPQVFNSGRVVTFSFGDAGRGSVASPDTGPASDVPKGIIAVATGSPAEGAQVFGAAPSTRVFATTLDDLERDYRDRTPGPVRGAESIEIDGVPARLLSVEGFPSQTLWVALVVNGGRSYVITAWGFPTIDAGSSAAATHEALAEFLLGFRFEGPPLYSNRILGLEVTAPIDDDVTGSWRDTGPISEANGTLTFHAGQTEDGQHWSHSIIVAVGSSVEAAPAVINATREVVPLWAPNLVVLIQRYSLAVGSAGYEVPTVLGGEAALYFDHPGGVGAALVAMHRGRVYILSTFGTKDASPAPEFQRFIDSFTFLDEVAAP